MAGDFEVPLEIRIKYLRRRMDEAQAIAEDLSRGRFEMAASIGHQVRGNAESFHFPTLTPFGERLEEAARSENQRDAERASLEMRTVAEQLLERITEIERRD